MPGGVTEKVMGHGIEKWLLREAFNEKIGTSGDLLIPQEVLFRKRKLLVMEVSGLGKILVSNNSRGT